MPKYEFMCESCQKTFEEVLTAARAGRREGCVSDLRQRRSHAPDGALYREDLTKELKTSGDTSMLLRSGRPTPGSRVRVIERRVEEAGCYVPKLKLKLTPCHQRVEGRLMNPSPARRA
jgi:hypothetical protein